MESMKSIQHEVASSHDSLRFGLPAIKGEFTSSHPLEKLHESFKNKESQTKRMIVASTYGSSLVLKMDLDQQILSRFQRPPGLLHSSMLGLDALTGDLDNFGVEDYLNVPRESETFRPVDMHHGMEVRVGVSKGPVGPTFL